jgi:DNA-binding MurR/RpiR family transcriptional regulator
MIRNKPVTGKKMIHQIEKQFGVMTRSQKRIGCYLIDHSFDLLFCTLAQLSERIGTSTTTIIRFAQLLGYPGFAEMQHAAREALDFDAGQALQEQTVDGAGSFPDAVSQNDLTDSERKKLDEACRMIMDAEDILIIGYKNSFGTAAELLHRLDSVRNDVYFARLIGDWRDTLRLMNANTLALIVSFEPHYAYTYYCTTIAAERGCSILALSEGLVNPYTAISDLMIPFQLKRTDKMSFPELTSVASFMNLLFEKLIGEFGLSEKMQSEDMDDYLRILFRE